MTTRRIVSAFVLFFCFSSSSVFAASSSSSSSMPPQHFTVPILMFHHIRDPKKQRGNLAKGLSVSPEKFSAQLDWLKEKGYHTITFANLVLPSALLPTHPVILTFDDGYADAFSAALPALQSHGMVGVFYIFPNALGRADYMTWQQLEQLRDAGMEIGAHTMSHANLPKFTAKQQQQEIVNSRDVLEQKLHIHIWSMAYPYGHYNNTSLKIVRDAKIPYAVTTHRGIAKDTLDHVVLPRERMNNNTSIRSILP